VELNDLKGAANYTMGFIAVPVEAEEAKFVVDRLIETPNRLLTFAEGDELGSGYRCPGEGQVTLPRRGHGQGQGGADAEKDLTALELEVQDTAMEVADSLDYEGDDGR
jgi:hypothetical protein